MLSASIIEKMRKKTYNPQKILYSGNEIQRILFGCENECWGKNKCGDCGCQELNLHYIGCDVERCPICGHQLISCEHIFECI